VHIERKCDLTTLLAAADRGNVEVFRQFLKHSACLVFAIEKCSELLKAAAKNSHIVVVIELLKIGASVKVSKEHG
jgi:hypothetical protein